MQAHQLSILEDIIQTITDSDDPDSTLDQIVGKVASHLAIDVCSVYVYNPAENCLVLKATRGLAQSSVDSIEMDVGEGLTGLALEQMRPVFVVHPDTHPRFKFYEGSGEEKYATFLGLPLIYHQKVLGVLVIQTVDKNGIREEDIPFFANIASQISATVAYTGLLEDLSRRRSASPKSVSRRPESDIKEAGSLHLRGDPVSEEVAEGYAHYLPENIDFDNVQCTLADSPETDIKRLEAAFENAAEQIRQVARQGVGVSDQESAILDAHLMFLQDTGLKKRIIDKIRSGRCAEFALKQVILEYVETFRNMDDAYLSERAADVLDIGRRVLGHLMGVTGDPHEPMARPTIVIASDISPVDLLAIRQPNLKAIVTASGGKTSHTVILAKSLQIPIVIGVEGLFEHVREKDYLVIDGASGFVFVNPDSVIREEYERRQKENRMVMQKLSEIRDLPAVTADGVHIRMGANIGLLSDVANVRQYGADHIGLYRTEFPFLLRRSFPSEEDQVSLYTRMLQKAEGRTVTIRTFDVGGDKFLSYLEYPKEENPFLGWRSIRISLELEEEFRRQIRAILRASAHGPVHLLFPMISGVEEIRKVVALVEEEKQVLDEKKIPYDKEISTGIMIEVPAAVAILEHLLKYVDFVSIGTNDLIQYLLAVDRNNKKVANLYNALHPSVIATIYQIVRICRSRQKPVSICGESAARPECLLLYVAMGADRLSMTPSSVPAAKRFIRSIRQSDAEKALDAVLEMEDAESVNNYLAEYIRNLVPEIPDPEFELQSRSG
ncbi:MAG: phosphoenolpyruvate--protein phosphotransferase [Desulfobacteraceae bacterium]|nr:phosphoenolpyruvate--protein phosphotransferase [Desulfobacteraceae bacterium]